MDESTPIEELTLFFKTLSDANRLRIIALLAEHDLSVEQLAEMLSLNSSTVSHHLSRLAKIGLVSAHTESYYNIYSLNLKALNEMSRRLLSAGTLPAVAAEVDLDAYDRKVIKAYFSPEGRLLAFPAQMKKLEAALRFIVKAFSPNQRYSEKQVNEILLQYNEDTAQLRRSLVEFGLMQREGGGGAYWRVEQAGAEKESQI